MKKIIITFFIIFCYPLFSQTLDFNSLNSKNILNVLSTENYRANSEQVSKTAILQIGDNNTAKIYDKSLKSDLLIRQTGDFNTTLMTNTNPNLENRQKVSVEGDNNYIDVTGNNGNSKEMQINLRTNDKMIFVRHY